MSRMFHIDGKPMKTWNVFIGCKFNCQYCSAKRMAETRLKHSERYKEGFKPRLVEKELTRTFSPGSFVFVAYMGDICFATREQVEQILVNIRKHPETKFLMLSKGPGSFCRWELDYPDNLIFGTTLESDKDFKVSNAPDPESRVRAMESLEHPHKFVSLEPLMDFHLRSLIDMIKRIGPEIVEIGPDNYHNHLEEVPPHKRWKVTWLLEMLNEFVPTVVEKQGLSDWVNKYAQSLSKSAQVSSRPDSRSSLLSR